MNLDPYNKVLRIANDFFQVGQNYNKMNLGIMNLDLK